MGINQEDYVVNTIGVECCVGKFGMNASPSPWPCCKRRLEGIEMWMSNKNVVAKSARAHSTHLHC